MDERSRHQDRLDASTRSSILPGVLVVRGGALAAGVLTAVFLASPVSAQDAQSVGDDETSRAILLVVAGLVVVGLVLTAITVWFWRSTVPEHPALAPLEVMGDKKFLARSAFEQRQALDAVRPASAEHTETSDVHDVVPVTGSEPVLDLQRLVLETPTSFEDLADSEARAEPTPASSAPHPAEAAEEAEDTPESPKADDEVEEAAPEVVEPGFAATEGAAPEVELLEPVDVASDEPETSVDEAIVVSESSVE